MNRVSIRSAVALAFALLLLPHPGMGEGLLERYRLRGFAHPTAVIDPSGNLYVADGGNNRIVKYSVTGDSLASVSGTGWQTNQFDGPSGVAVRGVDCFVADRGNHRVVRFDRNLNFVGTLSTRDNIHENERFGYPRGIAVSAQGDLYVLDGENFRVVKISPFNQVDGSFGSTDAGALRLIDPTSICAEVSGVIDIVDGGAVKRFDLFGTPRGIIPMTNAKWCAADAEGLFLLTDNGIIKYPTSENEPRTIALSNGAAWRGMAVTGMSVALWNDTEVVVFNLHP